MPKPDSAGIARGMVLNLLVFVAASFLVAGAMEADLRVFKPQITVERTPAGWYRKHPALPFCQSPGFEGVLETREFKVRFATNSLGLRDDEIADKVPDMFRILVLGDSFVWGFGAGQEDTYPSALERILAGDFPGKKMDVVNAGVCRYYPELEKTLFDVIVDEVKPDLVIQNVLPNDVWDEMAGRDAVTVSRDGRLVSGGKATVRIKRILGMRIPVPFSLGDFLRSNSHLYTFIADRIALLSARGNAPAGAGEENESSRYAAAMKGVFDDVSELADRCASDGIEYLLVLIPQKDRFEAKGARADFYERFERTMMESAAKRGIACFNAYSALAASPDAKELYWRFDGHFRPKGYARLAESVAEVLVRERFIPR